jgi:hypothetical protein
LVVVLHGVPYDCDVGRVLDQDALECGVLDREALDAGPGGVTAIDTAIDESTKMPLSSPVASIVAFRPMSETGEVIVTISRSVPGSTVMRLPGGAMETARPMLAQGAAAEQGLLSFPVEETKRFAACAPVALNAVITTSAEKAKTMRR